MNQQQPSRKKQSTEDVREASVGNDARTNKPETDQNLYGGATVVEFADMDDSSTRPLIPGL